MIDEWTGGDGSGGDPQRADRLVAGLMTGTSLDGVDLAVARLRGSGPDMEIEVRATAHRPYSEELRDHILSSVEGEAITWEQAAGLHVGIGRWSAEVTEEMLREMGIAPGELDLLGVHGQTVAHLPEAGSTLQLGAGSVVAARLGVPVVSDFRTADVARGGEGAPLVPYLDWIALTAPDRARLACNLGGIANVTVLPQAASRDAVRAFDTGPANMVVDALARALFDEPFDRDGRRARAGEVCRPLLEERMAEDEFLDRAPPKSTGRARYGPACTRRWIERSRSYELEPEDVIATATAYTAETLRDAYEQYVAPSTAVDEVLLSGGGLRNPVLVEHLRDAFDPVPVRSAAAAGLDPDGKEALCFAVLAHEFANGVSTALPAVTGADRAARLGQLALPPAD